MSYQKFKDEQYLLLKGINNKASVYVNGPLEFRDLKNLHFTEPGALNKRPGTSLYTGATVLGPVSFVQEFERLDGASFVFTHANTNLYANSTTAFVPAFASLSNSASFVADAEPFVNQLWIGTGQEWIYTNGQSTFNWNIPDTGRVNAAYTLTINSSLGFTGVVQFQVVGARVRDNTLVAGTPRFDPLSVDFGTSAAVPLLTISSTFGASLVFVYATNASGTDLFGVGSSPYGVTSIGGTLVVTPEIRQPNLNELDPIRLQGFSAGAAEFGYPSILEIYNNQMFSAGYTGLKSSFFWSQIGIPEYIEPDANAEVRTDDGDVISAMRTYSKTLMIFKRKSFARLSGDDPSNFLLSEITDQYGCLSNRATVIFEDYLWFLDRKGIAQYDGANVTIVSNPVEPIFKRMNISAANRAVAIHKKEDNEVWFAIPVDGSSNNNLIVVYDYFLQAWSTYESAFIEPATLAIINGHIGRDSVVFGGYTGSVQFFDDNIFNDIGNEIECVARTPFFIPGGKTTQKLFRRWYTDVNEVGTTQPIGLKLYANYDYSTVIIGRTFFQQKFQTRLDFGINARSMAGEINHSSASLPFSMNGYAMTYRVQRDK